MDVAQLQALVALAEQQSFSRAAEKLHISQPALSKRIAALEQDLGKSLFDRLGKQILPTEAGRALLPRARRLLGEMQECRRILAELDGDIGGFLQLATSHHIGLHRLPPLLSRYLQQYPAIELDFRFLDSEAACQAVAQAEIELALATLPPQEDYPQLARLALWQDPLVLVANLSHPLSLLPAPQASDLLEFPAILPEEHTFTRTLITQALAPWGRPLKTRLTANYLESIRMLVTVGLGWSLLPRTMLTAELNELSIPGIVLERTLGAVWHQQRQLSGAAQKLLRMLKTSEFTNPGSLTI